jgi:hypothetical protein
MKKAIIPLLLVTTFSTNLIGMKRNQSIIPLPALPVDIVQDIFNKSCHSYKTSKEFCYGVMRMCLLNKAYYSHINNPNTIRNIIDSMPIDAYFSRGTLTRGNNITSPIKLTGIDNYILQSEMLCKNIHTLNIEEIKQLVHDGADVSYSYPLYNIFSPISNCLMLDKVRYNDEKIQLLLELGADINKTHAIWTEYTPLKSAIQSQNIEIIKLFITYKPHYKCLQEAIQTGNPRIVQLVLQQEGISIDEIKEGMKKADILGNENIRDLLYRACLDKISFNNLLISPTDINYYIQYYKDNPQFFDDIIRLHSSKNQ